MSQLSWVPLESNPDVMNMFLQKVGLPQMWGMLDVYGLDKDLQVGIPRPVLALVLLFPTGQKQEDFSKQEEKDVSSKGQVVSENVFFMRQTIKNACGTIALIHCLANNADILDLGEDSILGQFLSASKGQTPEEKGITLETSKDICSAHETFAQEGQTEPPQANEDVNLHFVAFVHKDGHLYELDGRKPFPINHGETTPETLLEDASVVCKKFMERDPENFQFTMVALAPLEN